ncbi:hypothetical protein EZJ19_08685 [Parasulfuritortus cantonensis]|uniref:L,D-TPase catalytic domain-containing protein n=1 Tax=Parasulfuritortus cantonensis TaxID=2528202 RepID=A0A4R1BD60_9PROT|nr:L,D-transpeptidase family protein [Parasulfuritortus cantonensis]TCJ14947.1 hypothetical protein EZJ19_08685 [Parasulfuritortus cantonensis]
MNIAPYLLMAGLLAGVANHAGADAMPLGPAGDDLVGSMKAVASRADATLLDIASRYQYGYEQVRVANPKVEPGQPVATSWVLLPGRLVLPAAPRTGIVVNLPEMRLYYYPVPEAGRAASVLAYPIGIGKEGWQVPTLQARITSKARDPAWHVPAAIRREQAELGEPLPAVVPPGPDNPLGAYAMRIGATDYLIHGSNQGYGAGMRVSHGCLRMEPEPLRDLFDRVAVGTPVRIVNQPYKVAVHDGQLYLEAHPALAEERAETGKTAMVAALIRATGERPYRVDWDKAFRVVEQARGVPVVIGSLLP